MEAEPVRDEIHEYDVVVRVRLTGKTERVTADLRHSVNEAFRHRFPDYDIVKIKRASR